VSIPAVFDCGVVASGLGWNGNPRFCLDLVFAGQVILCVTMDVWQEYTGKIPIILDSRNRSVNAAIELARLLKLAQFFDPAPLGKQRARDFNDDRYLAAAMPPPIPPSLAMGHSGEGPNFLELSHNDPIRTVSSLVDPFLSNILLLFICNIIIGGVSLTRET
jgi:hypothetical protein